MARCGMVWRQSFPLLRPMPSGCPPLRPPGTMAASSSGIPGRAGQEASLSDTRSRMDTGRELAISGYWGSSGASTRNQPKPWNPRVIRYPLSLWMAPDGYNFSACLGGAQSAMRKTCRNCGSPYKGTRSWRKFCGRECKNAYRSRMIRKALQLEEILPKLRDLNRELSEVLESIGDEADENAPLEGN